MNPNKSAPKTELPTPPENKQAGQEQTTEQPFWAHNPLPWGLALMGLLMIIVFGIWTALNSRGANTPEEAMHIAFDAVQEQNTQRFEQVVPLEQVLTFSFHAFADSMAAHRRRQAETPRQELRARMGEGFIQALQPTVVQQGQQLIREAIETGRVQPPRQIPGPQGPSRTRPDLQMEMLDYNVRKTQQGQAEAEVRLSIRSGLRSGEVTLEIALHKYQDKWRIQGLYNGFSVLETLQNIVAPQAAPGATNRAEP